jgi:glyceraldehyde 3-phosphate dehydrogenase
MAIPLKLLQQRDPFRLPWHGLKIDLVLECTGLFTNRNQAANHLQAGARKIIVSAPGKDIDATIIYGVNHQQLDGSEQIISRTTCTTKCLAQVAKVLDQATGIGGLMTTIHAYTNDQHLCEYLLSTYR